MNGFGSPSGVHRITNYETGRPRNFTAIQVHQFLSQIQGVNLPISQRVIVKTTIDVKDKDLNLLSDYTIKVTDYNDNEITLNNGFYELFEGTFNVVITKAGYKRFSSKLVINNETLKEVVDGKLNVTLELDKLPESAWDGITLTAPRLDNDGYYLIENGAMLAWLSKEVNNGNKNINARLTNNIHLADMPWTPIGSSSSQYGGVFDGNGFAIEGLYINDSSKDYVALFGAIS